MDRLFKFISVFLALILLLCACGKQAETEPSNNTGEENIQSEDNTQTGTQTEKSATVRLPFNETDGINPFFAKSYENLYLIRLLYSSLFSVTRSFEPEPLVAASINVNGKNATVTVKSGLECHGAANITPADVVYSFNLAKNSYAYSASLKSIDSAVVSGNSVVFTSNFADSLVALKLTFPIVKENTADLQSDIPIGFGEYYFYENTLVSTNGAKPTISLTFVNTAETSSNAYKIGNTDILFNDLSDCNYTQLHGNFLPADINNMVYLGFNGNLGGLNKNIRSAIAVLLDSESIAQESYQGHAIACKAPCNPNSLLYKECGDIGISLSGDKKSAEQIIDRSGFTRYSGKALTNGAFVLSFSLIVNADNKYRVAAAYAIADTLNNAGFLIEVKPLSFADYSERIASGNYEMYIGETRLDYSMDLSEFFTEDGTLAGGIDGKKTAKSYFNMRSGKISYEDFYKTFVENYPFVPIAFRTGAVFSSNNFDGDFSHFPYDLYYGVELDSVKSDV